MVLNENETKLQFIANMKNRYDYAEYRDFCRSNGYECMSFSLYARTIEYELYPEPVAEPVKQNSSTGTGCCGGGVIR